MHFALRDEQLIANAETIERRVQALGVGEQRIARAADAKKRWQCGAFGQRFDERERIREGRVTCAKIVTEIRRGGVFDLQPDVAGECARRETLEMRDFEDGIERHHGEWRDGEWGKKIGRVATGERECGD